MSVSPRDNHHQNDVSYVRFILYPFHGVCCFTLIFIQANFYIFFFSSSYRFHTCLIVWVSLRERKWQRMWCGIINFVLWIYIFLIFGYTVNLTFLITINGYIFRTVILFFLFSFFLYFFFRLKILNYHFYYIIILFTIRYLNLPRLFNVSRCLSYSTFVSILRSFK